MGKVCLKAVYQRDRDIIYNSVMRVMDRYKHLPCTEKTHVLRLVVHKVEEAHGVGSGSGRDLILNKSGRGDRV